MTQNPHPTALPPLSELLAHYLQRQAQAQEAGLVGGDVSGEVVPFEAAPVQPVDPRLAWNEALAAVRLLQGKAEPQQWQVPPDWPTLVAAQEPAMALACCLGNFPQLVRNLHPLLHATDLAALRPNSSRPVATPSLLDWAGQVARKKQYPQTLIAVGALRLARHFDRAAEMIKGYQADVPAAWRAAWANEEAALAWHQGQGEKALKLWQAQPTSVPVLFNRAMAALFLEQSDQARPALQEAVAQLPEDSAWHHLGKLYLALAEMRA